MASSIFNPTYPGSMGGTGADYSSNVEDAGLKFGDVKSAEAFFKAKAAAKAANPVAANPYAVTSKETPAQTSARNIAEQTYYQKLMNSQIVPPSGGGGDGTSWGRGTSGTTTPYATGLVPPGTGGSQLTIPVYDQRRVTALAQQVAAPGIAKLRDQVQQVQGASSDNPNVKAMTLRQALEGYGQGLGSVMSGAQTTGAAMYGAEYNPQVAAATANYQGNLSRELQANSLASQEAIAAANRESSSANQAANDYAQQWSAWRNTWG